MLRRQETLTSVQLSGQYQNCMHLLNLDTTNNKLQQARTQINYRSASIEIRISINSRLSHVTVFPPRKKKSPSSK